MNFCPFCGQKISGDSAFCPYCGRPLAGAAQTPPAQTAHVQTAPAPKKRRVWVWALAAVLVLALAAGGFLVWQAFSKPDISTFSPSVLYLEGYDEGEHVVCSGSGFFIENGPEGDPLLVTNYHVIEGCAGLDVWDSDFENYVQAKSVVAYDEVADLAILRCEPGLDVAPLTLAGEDVGIQGDEVYAIGYPLGIANTLSNGIISSRYYDEYDMDVLQITAPISSGSSGGALLNEDGLVVGVTVASYVDGENMNLAIAAHQVSSLLANAGEETTLEVMYKTIPRWHTVATISNFDPSEYYVLTVDQFLKSPGSYLGMKIAVSGYLNNSSFPDGASLFESPDSDRFVRLEYEDIPENIHHQSVPRKSNTTAYGVCNYDSSPALQGKSYAYYLWVEGYHYCENP